MAPRMEAIAAGVIAPVGSAGRRGAATPAAPRSMAPSSMASASSAASHVLLEAGQLGGPGILRHQQARLVRDRRRTRPARARPPAPGCRPRASRPAPSRRHRECARPGRGRRRARAACWRPRSGCRSRSWRRSARPAPGRRWRRASPPISRVARSPLRSMAAAALTASSDTFGGARGRRCLGDAVGRAPGRVGRQDQGGDLPGRLPRRLDRQRRRPPQSCAALGEVLTQCDMGAATPSMSAVSGAS